MAGILHGARTQRLDAEHRAGGVRGLVPAGVAEAPEHRQARGVLDCLVVQEVRHSPPVPFEQSPRQREAPGLDDARAASKWSSSTHTDPGPNYPLFGKVSFNALLLYYRARIAAGLKPMEAA